MMQAMEQAKKWFNNVNSNMYIDHVFSGGNNSKMRKTKKQNKDTIKEFANPSRENENKLKLLFCVNMANEAIHIPNISGVILLRPTESPVLFVQHTGRAFVTADKEGPPTVIIDPSNNWLRFYEFYTEISNSIKKGFNKIEKKDEDYKRYDSYNFSSDELDLLEFFKEVDYEFMKHERSGFREYINWIKQHQNIENGEYIYPRGTISKDGRTYRLIEMEPDEVIEYRLAQWYKNSNERDVLEKYVDVDITNIPKEFREIIETGRKYGLGKRKKTRFEEYIEWLDNHVDANTGLYIKPSVIKRLTKDMTEEERYENNLARWWNSKAIKNYRKIIDDYIGIDLEDIPDEHREIIKVAREHGLGLKEPNKYDLFIEWIETHTDDEERELWMYNNPRSTIHKEERTLKLSEMTEEEIYESRLGQWWKGNPEERQLLEKFKNYKLEEVPEEFRELVKKGRNVGLGVREKTMFEKYIRWTEMHFNEKKGIYRQPRSVIYKDGVILNRDKLSKSEKIEVRYGSWWQNKSKEKKILTKNKDISKKEFMELPDYEKYVILTCAKYKIGENYSIMQKMKEFVGEYVKSNDDTRNELSRLVKIFESKEASK